METIVFENGLKDLGEFITLTGRGKIFYYKGLIVQTDFENHEQLSWSIKDFIITTLTNL